MSNECLMEIRRAIIEQDLGRALEGTKRCLDSGVAGKDIIDTVAVALKEVGDLFECGEMFLPEVVRSCRCRRAADDFRLERNDPVRDDPYFFQDQKMVAVSERNDRVGCFLNAFDMIRIEVKFASVEPGKLYHDIILPEMVLFFILQFG